MTINLFFITLSITRKNESKEVYEKNKEITRRMEGVKEREYELFRNM
ncbi:YrzI family small protein [Bacillus weihaiensis]|nr:YrzI family small protein [Bacillus weihaiensis]